jgi:hypothetical protein
MMDSIDFLAVGLALHLIATIIASITICCWLSYLGYKLQNCLEVLGAIYALLRRNEESKELVSDSYRDDPPDWMS